MREPLFLEPVYKDYLWGGDSLKTQYNKNTEITPVAESWELCCHKDGESIILNGSYKGQTLTQYLAEIPTAVCDTPQRFADFPLLIKLIDAKQLLSVQVHPDNVYALANEGEQGKTEMWYVVDCEPGAELLFGFNQVMTKETFRKSIEDNTFLDYVKRVPVSPGDVFLVEATTLHAIGAGIIIAEIQQNSNSTYRVYDFGRMDKEGRQRPLHIEKAIDVARLTPSESGINPLGQITETDSCVQTDLARCDYFDVARFAIHGEHKVIVRPDGFQHLLVLTAEPGSLIRMDEMTYPITKGCSIFIPAQTAQYILAGRMTVLHTSLPEISEMRHII